MTEFDIDLTSAQLETDQLSAHDKIEIAKNADQIWINVEVALFPLDHYLVEHIGDVPADTSFIEEPIEEYIETVRLLEKIVTTAPKDIQVFGVDENRVSLNREFERYEGAKAWAEEMENQTSELPSAVTLDIPADSLPSETIEEIKMKRQHDL